MHILWAHMGSYGLYGVYRIKLPLKIVMKCNVDEEVNRNHGILGSHAAEFTINEQQSKNSYLPYRVFTVKRITDK